MKKSFLFILSIVAMICLLSSQFTVKANVYTQFNSVGTKGFQWIDTFSSTGYTRIPETDFKVNWQTGSPTTDTELDDGYAKIPLGFSYRYNDSTYSSVYVSINGFITFDPPQNNTVLSRRDTNFFRAGVGLPSNVIAPYWGDHKYWQKDDPQIKLHGCEPSEIGYEWGIINTTNPIDNTPWEQKYCLIRWSNLNVNWRTHPEWANEVNPDPPDYFYGNIASFQVIIYEGPNATTAPRGDVEFQYNTLGRTQIQTENFPNSILNPANRAAIGVNGKGLSSSGDADFINALYNGNRAGYSANIFDQRNQRTFATEWPPSWNATHSIILRANYSTTPPLAGDTIWGDGDADMSKIAGERHNQYADFQNVFVTMNDVRRIMVALIDGKPLDSAYKMEAFHGDVNHDGRYYYFVANDVRVSRYFISDPNKPSKDTFYISLELSNSPFGFLPYYGKNNDYIEMDFIGLGTVDMTNRYRKVKLIDPFPSNGNRVRVTLLNLADTTVMLAAVAATNGQFPEDKVSFKMKKNINWADSTYKQGLEGLPISDAQNEIFWEANEDDAADIISYLEGRHPYLPWWYGNTVWQRPGKISVVPYQYANNIIFQNAEMLDNGTVKIPVYVNGLCDGTLSSLFTLNTDIVNFESAHPDLVVEYSNETKKAVFAANGYFTANSPIAYLFVKNNEQNEIKATSVRFKGNSVSDVSLKLKGRVLDAETNSAMQIKTNPVVTNTDIVLNIANTGNYSLAIYDVNGNLVKTLSNGLLSAGNHQFTFNVSGEAEGTYFCRLESENVSLVVKKIIIVR